MFRPFPCPQKIVSFVFSASPYNLQLKRITLNISKHQSPSIHRRVVCALAVAFSFKIATDAFNDRAALAEFSTGETNLKIWDQEEITDQSERSQSHYGIDSRPGLTRVVADTFEEVVLDEKKDVFLQVWASWCETCKMLAPVFYQLAEALEEVDTIDFAYLESGPNYKNNLQHVFLTDTGEEATPILRLYPVGKKNNPIEYEFKKVDAESILRFIHKNATHPFDIEPVLQKLQKSRPKANERLRLAVGKMPIRAALLGKPCGNLMWSCFEAKLIHDFLPAEDDMIHLANIHSRYGKCMEKTSELSSQYWSQLSKHSKFQVDKFMQIRKTMEKSATKPMEVD